MNVRSGWWGAYYRGPGLLSLNLFYLFGIRVERRDGRWHIDAGRQVGLG